MAEKSRLGADERGRILGQIELDRSQGFISDAARIASANHKASRESGERALAVRRTSL
jgi:hypothetical protein